MFVQELLGIIFQEACDSSWIRLTQVIFSAFSMILKSHIFNQPFFFSPIMVFLLILGVFPAQVKLKISLFISWTLPNHVRLISKVLEGTQVLVFAATSLVTKIVCMQMTAISAHAALWGEMASAKSARCTATGQSIGIFHIWLSTRLWPRQEHQMT